MTEDTVRCWLVERNVSDRDIVTLVYATPDGARYYRRQLSGALLSSVDVTAATEVPEPDLESTPDEDRDRYREEAGRMADRHGPDDVV